MPSRSRPRPTSARAARAASVWLILLGLLAAGAAHADDPATPPAPAAVLAVDPDEPGPDLPPRGRSLFDFVTMQEEGGRAVQVVPFPFTALLAKIEAEVGDPSPSLKKVLIPLGRSLQRNAANPDFFAFPRAVVAVDQDPALRPDHAGMLLADRLYLGYQEKAATIEVISYNEAAGRFEYQVVRDYREGGAAKVYYADRPTCIACHRNHAPIFSKPLWDETNANAAIAATLAALQDEFYGIPVARGVDIPNAFDAATDRANSFAALQRIWQEGCELAGHRPTRSPAGPTPCSPCCSTGLPATAIRRRTGTVRARRSRRRCARSGRPCGRAGSPCPRRTCPIASRSRHHSTRMCRSARRTRSGSTSIERAFEPFEPRPPREVWHAPATPEQAQRLVEGLAQFIASADIQRLDDFLWQQDAPSRDIEGSCEIATVDLSDGRREVRIGCPGPEGLMLQGYVQLQGDAVNGRCDRPPAGRRPDPDQSRGRGRDLRRLAGASRGAAPGACRRPARAPARRQCDPPSADREVDGRRHAHRRGRFFAAA